MPQPDPPGAALTNYLGEGILAPERQVALARAWLAAGGDTVTPVSRVTVLRPMVSARVPRDDVAVAE